MSKVVDYYVSLQSPWTYLGHQRLIEICSRHQAAINIRPVDYSKIFPVTGGLPLPKRAPARRAYRMSELRRWRDFLGATLNLQPQYFPVNDRAAARMVVAARQSNADDAIRLAGSILKAVWAEERNIDDLNTLGEIAQACELDASRLLEESQSPATDEAIESDTQLAIESGVFGAPTYVYNGELFWGQDRLDFVDRALAR